LRTLCAISSNLLKEDFDIASSTARQQIVSALSKLISGRQLMSNYAEKALEHIDTSWDTSDGAGSILEAYRARLCLVRLVTAFLFSESIAAQIYHEPYVARGSPTGYDKKRNSFDLNPIGSPLRFLRAHLSPAASETDSLWILQNLAFNTEVS
jgi:hypothetical protein